MNIRVAYDLAKLLLERGWHLASISNGMDTSVELSTLPQPHTYVVIAYWGKSVMFFTHEVTVERIQQIETGK